MSVSVCGCQHKSGFAYLHDDASRCCALCNSGLCCSLSTLCVPATHARQCRRQICFLPFSKTTALQSHQKLISSLWRCCCSTQESVAQCMHAGLVACVSTLQQMPAPGFHMQHDDEHCSCTMCQKHALRWLVKNDLALTFVTPKLMQAHLTTIHCL